MSVVVATSVDEAVAALAADPEAEVLAGGTDLMVGINAGTRRPTGIVAVGAIVDLRSWSQGGGSLRLGAGVSYTRLLEEDLAGSVPALAQAARTVGSPQIRNAGTIGGNLATASPAGDTLPVLAALDAEVELTSQHGRRVVPISLFLTGPKATCLVSGELITAVHIPRLRGQQEFLKVGVRNAMVIALASLALIVDADGRTVRVGLGSVGPTVLRATEAEAFVAGRLDWDGRRPCLPSLKVADHFAQLVAAAARPIDDHRSSAAYRRHAIGVLARRALLRAVDH